MCIVLVKLEKILFIVDMHEEQKTGLFNASYNRISYLSKHIEDYEVYSIKEYDGKVLTLLKKIFNKSIKRKSKESYRYGDIEINYFYMKNTIFSTFLKKIGIYFPIIIAMKMKKVAKGYQMICAHWGHPQGSIARLISKLSNVPYIVTYHGGDIHSIPSENKLFSKCVKKNLRDSSLNVFVSQSLKEISLEKLDNSNPNNVVIPNGIDFEVYHELSQIEIMQVKNQLGFKKKIVGFVGNLYEVKRADRLPEIFRGIQLEYSIDVDFLVIGDGKLRSYIEQKCKEYQLNVSFIGKVEPKEVNKYMNIMDVLILPSRREAFGLVVLEANASGTLVIGSDVGGISEVIDNKDFIVKDIDDFEKSMARKVVYYLKNGYVKDELIHSAQARYNLNELAKKEYDILSEILNRVEGYNK
ncbi:hypothetical protein COL13_12270 [Bacillus cereus]|nr:hypothetical protein COL13_12270 [Bacillus cereus]